MYVESLWLYHYIAVMIEIVSHDAKSNEKNGS